MIDIDEIVEEIEITPSPEDLVEMRADVIALLMAAYTLEGDPLMEPLAVEILVALPSVRYYVDSEKETLVAKVPEKHKKCVALLERGTPKFRPLGKFLDRA